MNDYFSDLNQSKELIDDFAQNKVAANPSVLIKTLVFFRVEDSYYNRACDVKNEIVNSDLSAQLKNYFVSSLGQKFSWDFLLELVWIKKIVFLMIRYSFASRKKYDAKDAKDVMLRGVKY